MIAALTLSPTTRDVLHVLQGIADVLVRANAAWLRSQLDRGVRPPSSLADARPPWSRERVRYVSAHGAAVGTTRVYQDGPTAMSTGRATCMDIACYDAPASSLLLGRELAVRVLPIDDANPSSPLRCHAWLVTSRGELVDPVAAFGKDG